MIAITERQREIATFRVLGYNPSEVGAIFLRENMLINIFGAVIGLPLGLAMLRMMIAQYCNDAYSMQAVVKSSTWLWTMGLSVCFVLAAHAVVQRNIVRLAWQEALSMKE